ncbi:MAG: hypothetical protein P8X97_08340 [Candidatus Bathyarchaeota archaeon]
MRWNHRTKIKIGNRTFTVFVMFSETQTLEGITSQVMGREGYHYPLFDIERTRETLLLEEVEYELGKIQVSYGLSNIYLMSDKKGSFRGWCFDEVRSTDYLRMQLDLLDAKLLDWNFFYWTVNKGIATLRANSKKDRPRQKLVSTLYSYEVPVPNKYRGAFYDTGIEKRGSTIFLGEKARIIRSC